MRSGNPIEALAQSLYSALHIHLPDIEYIHQTPQERRDGKEGTIKKRRPRTDEVDVYMFPQMWGSTALGFGGIGGAAMTHADTVVICTQDHASVFFGGGHAYTLPITRELMIDVHQGSMSDVRGCGKYKVEPHKQEQQ